MGYIASFLNDKLIAKEAELLVDETMARLKQRTGLLDKLMPLQTYDSDEFLTYITESLSPAASIVSPDGLIPMSSFGTFRRAVGELAKFALGFQFDETMQKQMMKAMEEASYKNATVQNMTMSDGTIMRGTNEQLVQFLYGSITKLIQAHVDRMGMLAWQVLQYGEINFEDPRTRNRLNIDYKRAGVSYNHFPAPLVGTGNLADRTQNVWTDYANADGLTLIFNAIASYIDTNGYKPKYVIMSWRLRNHLMQQATTKEAARSMAGTPQIGAVGNDMLKKIFEARELPELIIFDEFYQEEVFDGRPTNTADNNVRNVRFFNEDRFIFANDNMGQRAIGQTLEAKLARDNGDRNLGGNSSILVQVKSDPYAPVRDFTQSLSCGVSWVANPKQLYSQKVVA